jgi:hypothetical protein
LDAEVEPYPVPHPDLVAKMDPVAEPDPDAEPELDAEPEPDVDFKCYCCPALIGVPLNPTPMTETPKIPADPPRTPNVL